MTAYQRVFRDTEGHLVVGVGYDIEWRTPEGDVHRGRILEIESDIAWVHCTDGKQRRLELMSGSYGCP